MQSAGTKHSLSYAEKMNVKTIIIGIEEQQQHEKGIDLWQM